MGKDPPGLSPSSREPLPSDSHRYLKTSLHGTKLNQTYQFIQNTNYTYQIYKFSIDFICFLLSRFVIFWCSAVFAAFFLQFVVFLLCGAV